MVPLAGSLSAITLRAWIAGGAFGFLTGTYKAHVTILHSTEFLKWRIKAIEEKIYPLFLGFLKNDPILKKQLCILSQDIIQVPYRDPHGHVYEKVAVERLFRSYHDQVLCPHEEGMIQLADLVPDYAYHKYVIQRMREILSSENLDPNLRNGIDIYITNVKAERDQMARQELLLIAQELGHRIDPDQHRKMRNEIMEKYAI